MLEFLFLLQYQCFLVIILLSIYKHVAISLVHKGKLPLVTYFLQVLPLLPYNTAKY